MTEQNPTEKEMIRMLVQQLHELGMTESDLARLLGTKRQHMHDVLTGKRHKTDLDRWAVLLGIRNVISYQPTEVNEDY